LMQGGRPEDGRKVLRIEPMGSELAEFREIDANSPRGRFRLGRSGH
jgi:hypothetical protein